MAEGVAEGTSGVGAGTAVIAVETIASVLGALVVIVVDEVAATVLDGRGSRFSTSATPLIRTMATAAAPATRAILPERVEAWGRSKVTALLTIDSPSCCVGTSIAVASEGCSGAAISSTFGTGATGVATTPEKGRSAAIRSFTVAKRASRSFSRQRRISASKSDGKSSRISVGRAGAACSTFMQICGSESP